MQGHMIRIPLAFVALISCSTLALAQAAPPAPARPVDPAMAGAQAAFEALPEAERKAIQTDLIWGADFSGTASGSFGPLTFNAIKAYQKANNVPIDGILTPQSRKALGDAAQRVRTQVKFSIINDARSGARIGVPQAILPKQDVSQLGTSRWQSNDGKITLDMRVGQASDTLESLYDKSVGVAAPGRKVTYKLLRPDFYVVTGETDQGRFYSRMAKGVQGLRGFAIGYDKSVASAADKLVIAIANSFDPFPTGPIPTVPSQTPQVASAPTAGQPMAVPTPGKPTERQASGLQVTQAMVVTSASAIDACRSISANGRPAQVAKQDGALALLTVGAAGKAPSSLRLRKEPADPATELVVMSIGEATPGQRRPVAIPAGVRTMAKGAAINAPLQAAGAGSAAFDRHGALVGLVTGVPDATKTIAGVIPQRSYGLSNSAELEKFLGANGVALGGPAAGSEMTVGQIVGETSASVVAISCAL